MAIMPVRLGVLLIISITVIFYLYPVYKETPDVQINLTNNLPNDLLENHIWIRVSNTRFECKPLNLAIDIIKVNSKFRLSGLKDNDELLVSPHWDEISAEISKRTLNY